MAVVTLSRRTKDGARKRLRTTSQLQSKFLYLLLGCRFYSQIRAIVNDVVIALSLFFASLFCYFFTHISQRSNVNTLDDAMSNALLKETMSSPPVSYGNPPPHRFSVFKSLDVPVITVHKTMQANDVIKFKMAPRGKLKTKNGRHLYSVFSSRKSFVPTR